MSLNCISGLVVLSVSARFRHDASVFLLSEVAVWFSLIIATVAKIVVRESKLRTVGVKRIPHGVKFRRRPTIATRARLIPILRATRSIVSRFSDEALVATSVGYDALMNV